MQMRHVWTACVLVAFVGCRSASPTQPPPRSELVEPTDDPREALARAFEELRHIQNSDGSWSSPALGADPVATTALAALALTRDPEPTRQEGNEAPVTRGVRWLVGEMQSGTWNDASGATVPALVHCIATTAMAEAYGKSKSFLLRPYAQRTLERTLAHADLDDAWAAGWRLVALCSAETAGLKVPSERIDDGADALLRRLEAEPNTLPPATVGALEAVVLLCRTRAKATPRDDLDSARTKLASLTPTLRAEATAAALDHAHFGLRALVGATDVHRRWSTTIAADACALWNEHASATAKLPSANGGDAASLARLALCLVESVRSGPAVAP